MLIYNNDFHLLSAPTGSQQMGPNHNEVKCLQVQLDICYIHIGRKEQQEEDPLAYESKTSK